MKTERKIELLQNFIQIKTINGNEEKGANFIKALFDQAGIDAKLVNYDTDRSNLVAEIGNQEGKKIGLSGHFDVVSEGDLGQWTYPPFEGHIVDGKMYGRGTTDMKAGLLACAIAMIELKEEGAITKGAVKLLATVGEEIGMLGSQQLTQEGYVDDLDALLIAEPTGKGIINNGNRGSILMNVNSYGKTAHSSTPDKGINAIEQLVIFINRIDELLPKLQEKYPSDFLGVTLNQVTIIEGGTQINSVPANASISMNTRTVDTLANDKVIKMYQEIIDELNEELEGNLELVVTQSIHPVSSAPDSPLINSIKNSINRDFVVQPTPGATDASNFVLADKDFDIAIYGPGDISLAHQIDEYVEIDEYLEFIDELKLIIKEYLKD